MYNNFALYVYVYIFSLKKIMRNPTQRDYIILITFIRYLTWDQYFYMICYCLLISLIILIHNILFCVSLWCFNWNNNHNGGVMVSVLPSSAVDRGFEPRLGKPKDYKIGICCFSAKHTVKNVGAILINVGSILTRPILQRGDLTRYDRHSFLDFDCKCWSYTELQIIFKSKG